MNLSRSNNKNHKNENTTTIRHFNSKEIAIHHPSTWYEFDNKSKNPNEIIAMKTNKGKRGTFSLSIANAGGKSIEWWKDFMKKFLFDNGATVSYSKIDDFNGVANFEFLSELQKSGISSKQKHFGFINDDFFYYSFFTSLDLDSLEEDIDFILNSSNFF